MSINKKDAPLPHEILAPKVRWYPGADVVREKGRETLLPPLVHKLRELVAKWRAEGYAGASATSLALLQWWFIERQIIETQKGQVHFHYYFAQREAVETVIYCIEIGKVEGKYDFITKYDSTGEISARMFPEEWVRMVIKMATGTGKTKVMSLLMAWSYFHKLYEDDSKLARNFLLITPNIIVLDRLKRDFGGLKIFYEDPVLPENGHAGQNWLDDFQMRVHLQDNVSVASKVGNIFLTNIHRIYSGASHIPDAADEDTSNYFLGEQSVANTGDSKINLAEIVSNVDEIVVLNDEAHHIHDEKLAWFKAIENISNTMKMNGNALSMQLDFTATPRHSNGAIFVQTVSDYPLVEAIYQNIVKHPVLPDAASRATLHEYNSVKFTEKYKDYIQLGYEEWKKTVGEHERAGQKAVLFIMADDTKNCDEVAKYLESNFAEFEDATLVIHTKRNGEIQESSGANPEELKKLRAAADNIDSWDSPYKAIVSVLMLKEGWDTRNVTTIVGLRAYAAKSNILPEQTLGRGLRRMYPSHDVTERVSVIGTNAFMEFVESIKVEGVELEEVPMGEDVHAKASILIDIDPNKREKEIAKLDIELPVLSARLHREYRNLDELDVSKLAHQKRSVQKFSEADKRTIVFRAMTDGTESHTTELDGSFVPIAQNVIGFFARTIYKELRLVGGYDVLYGKIKTFVIDHLFGEPVDLNDLNVLRNLAESDTTQMIVNSFKAGINALTVVDKGNAELRDDATIKVSHTKPFWVHYQKFFPPQKSVFGKIVGQGNYELDFAKFLDGCTDIISFAKNYLAINFKLDYQKSTGELSNYHPDFFVKVSDKQIYIIETKGLEDVEARIKFKRLCLWCEDVNALSDKVKYTALYVRQTDYEKYRPQTFDALVRLAEKA